jgi:hypothetical protein
MYHNFMAWLPEYQTPIAISYKATGLKISKQFLASVRLTRLPMYAKKYKVVVTETRDGSNMWYEKKVIPQGFVDKEVYNEMLNLFESLKQTAFKVDSTGEVDTSFNPDSEPSTYTEL